MIGSERTKLEGKYCHYMGFKFKAKKNSNKYKFEEDKQLLGAKVILMPNKGHSIIKFNVDLVAEDVPLLIGIDVLDKCIIYPNTVENKLFRPELDFDIPLLLNKDISIWNGQKQKHFIC